MALVDEEVEWHCFQHDGTGTPVDRVGFFVMSLVIKEADHGADEADFGDGDGCKEGAGDEDW